MPLIQEIGKIVLDWVEWLNHKEGAYISSDVIRGIAQKFFGSKLAVDFSTHEGKALATKMIQDREGAKESLILCNLLWPMEHTEYSENHLGDSSIESKVFSAVTGNELDENGLYHLGERIFNLQRAIFIREGHRGRQDDTLPEFFHTVPVEGARRNPDCLVPGKDGQPVSKKGTVVDREKFEKLKDDYYALRGWDVATGRQTTAMLRRLGLKDVAGELEQRGLVVREPKVLA